MQFVKKKYFLYNEIGHQIFLTMFVKNVFWRKQFGIGINDELLLFCKPFC